MALGHELEGGSVIADDLESRRSVFLAGHVQQRSGDSRSS
jgi:hypothetical protein